MDGHQEIFASVSGVIGPFRVQILGVVLGVLQPGHRRRTTGTCKPWANLLIWGSVAASTYIVMIAAGGGLMFRSLGDYDDKRDDDHDDKPGNGAD